MVYRWSISGLSVRRGGLEGKRVQFAAHTALERVVDLFVLFAALVAERFLENAGLIGPGLFAGGLL